VSYRYIGNKTRLLPQLGEIICEQLPKGAVVADLMCGTGAVAAEMRRVGFRVVASDIMTFAYLHAKVRLTMATAPAFAELDHTHREYSRVLDYLNALPPVAGYFHREHSPAGIPSETVPPRGYFTPSNAGRLDAIVSTIRDWHETGALSDEEFVLLRHDLVLAANRVANIAGTYGHFRSKWSASALAHLTLLPTNFERRGGTNHVVKQGPAEEVAAGVTADVCYLDPPYTKRQYAANYHVLETLARCDEPPAIGLSGLRPWRDQYSDFCSKVRVRDSFRAIISRMECPRFVISYSEDGLLLRGEMEALLSEFGRVRVRQLRGQRFRSNGSALPRSITEFVFLLDRS
jgi:adenine-specific DNA-methyltransferase